VSVDDVCLCARRSSSLSEFITKKAQQLRADKESSRGTSAEEGVERPRKKTKKSS